MTDIIPGYDFDVNEVPNRDKFFRQARGISIRNVDENLLPGTFLRVLSGNNSGNSGATLPAEGWIWADPMGNLWVEMSSGTNTSDITSSRLLWRAEGGWSTGRYLYRPNPAQLPTPGLECHWDTSTAGNTDTLFGLRNLKQRLEQNGRFPFMMLDNSGATGPIDALGRGPTPIGYEPGNNATYTDVINNITGWRSIGASGAHWNEGDIQSADSNFRAWPGWMSGITPNTSAATDPAIGKFDYSVEMYGYFFGIHMWGPGDAD